jgi:hypothetical protein
MTGQVASKTTFRFLKFAVALLPVQMDRRHEVKGNRSSVAPCLVNMKSDSMSTKGDNTKNSSVFYWQSLFNDFSISLEIAAMVKF